MKLFGILFIAIFGGVSAQCQWVATNLGIGKNISDIYYFSTNESYLLCGSSVLKSSNNGNNWSEILFDSTWQFVYLYRYNNDSILLNSSNTKYLDSQKIFRYYNNKGFKLIRSYGYNVFERNVLKLDGDTFLNIYNEIGGGVFSIAFGPRAFSNDITLINVNFLHIAYYGYYYKLQSFQLLDDTLLMTYNKLDNWVEKYPIIRRNNSRMWLNDTGPQAEMTNLPPCRGLWAFTADSMILLGENYIARIPHYPTLQSMQYFPNYSFKKIIFSSHDTGFVIGRNITTNRGIILRTTDGGLTWKEQQLISCPPINDIAVITSQTLLAACNEGVLLRTETGGSNPVGITQSHEAIYASVYPNPANGGFTISVPGKSYDFTIYNGQGQNLTQGNSAQKTEVHCEDWASGIYMVLLSIDGTQQVLKVQVTH